MLKRNDMPGHQIRLKRERCKAMDYSFSVRKTIIMSEMEWLPFLALNSLSGS
jgi:hypothetical protein